MPLAFSSVAPNTTWDPTKSATYNVGDIAAEVGDVWGTIFKSIIDLIPGASQIIAFIKEITGIDLEDPSSILDKLGNFLGFIPNALGSLLQLVGQFFSAGQDIVSGTFDPVKAVEGFVNEFIGPTGLLVTVEGLAESIAEAIDAALTAVLDGLTGSTGSITILEDKVADVEQNISDIISTIEGIPASIAALGDSIYNAVFGSGATGVGLSDIGKALAQMVKDIQTSKDASTAAYNVTKDFGALIHTLVEDLEANPVYQGAEDFITNAERFMGTLWTNIVTSLTGQNPAVSGTNSQVNAIWAHLTTGQSAFRWEFDPTVPLNSQYLGGSNLGWVAPTGFSLPDVPGDYILNVFDGFAMCVETGQPMATGRYQVEYVIKNRSNYGVDGLFVCGDGTTGLANFVGLNHIHQSFGDALELWTYTAPNTRHTKLWHSPDNTNVGNGLGTKLGVQVDETGVDTVIYIFVNDEEVGSYVDSGNLITVGASNRNVGMRTNINNASFSAGCGGGSFIAYDVTT